MPRKKQQASSVRRHVGRVSDYVHHDSWWVYYREAGQSVRKRVAETEVDAERIAAQINAQLVTHTPTLLSFTPIPIPNLREAFLNHHEHVLCSSVGTILHYRAAMQHLVNYVVDIRLSISAHEIRVDRFVGFLRSREVAPNGHRNSVKRRRRDKGVLSILQVCRSMYGFAQKMRHLL